MRQAKEAAGDANVLVHGADLAQSCLRAGVLDELEIHLVPVLLGAGRPLFEHLGADHVELELTRVVDAPGVTHLRYRVASMSAERRLILHMSVSLDGFVARTRRGDRLARAGRRPVTTAPSATAPTSSCSARSARS